MVDVPLKNSTAKALDRQEVRCPECGKLLLKGRFAPGTELRLQCRGTKCRYHRKPFSISFFTENQTNMNKESQEEDRMKERSVSHVRNNEPE